MKSVNLSIDQDELKNEWRCAGCGILTPSKIRRCDCATNVVTRGDVGGEQSWKLDHVSQLILEQSNDEGLWFVAQTPGEDILQRALRRLHAAIEGKSPGECAHDVLTKHLGAAPVDFPVTDQMVEIALTHFFEGDKDWSASDESKMRAALVAATRT